MPTVFHWFKNGSAENGIRLCAASDGEDFELKTKKRPDNHFTNPFDTISFAN